MQQKWAATPERFTVGKIEDVIVRDLRKFNDQRGWLSELFRNDELTAEFFPTMAYISSTMPGVTRGPHEHVDQADLFCFPKGVVHAYQNVGDVDGIVINCPNRLYQGAGRREQVDEIRHEDDPDTRFRMDD
jgi:dTDP-4-dehydrorhamnose 3,5-epimerase